MPKVSIILPIYNVEQYLEQCLETVKRQTLKDIEIICVNDGSKDRSLEIIHEFAKGDDRFVVIDKENGGYGKAMNTGLDKATGEYIGIVEPDDYVPLNMFEDLYDIASSNQLDFVKADFYRFTTDDKNGDMMLIYNHLDKTGTHYGKLYDPSETPVLTRFIMNTWSGIYRRAFLNENGIRHNETPGASFQDNGFFWQTFLYAKRAMFVDKPYYMNRRDNPNSSVNSREKVYSMNIEYDYIRGIFMRPENREKWEIFKGYYNLKRWDNYTFTLSRISDEFKKEYVERIAEEFRRSQSLGELQLDLFTPHGREKIKLLMKNPEKFYQTYANSPGRSYTSVSDLKKAKKRENEIRNSTTYKVGKAVMFVPIAVKNIIRKPQK